MNKIHKIYDYIGPDGNLQSKRFNAEKTIDAIIAALNESQEPKESCPECHYPKGVAHSRKCSLRRDGLVGDRDGHFPDCHCPKGENNCAEPQDEPKCCEECDDWSHEDGNGCSNRKCPCHQESETKKCGWHEPEMRMICKKCGTDTTNYPQPV